MTSAYVKGVLDLTFLDIKDEIDLTNGLPSRIKHVLPNSIHHHNNNNSHNSHNNNETTIADTTLTMKSTNSPSKKSKEEVIAIRLGNNYIDNLGILYGAASDDPNPHHKNVGPLLQLIDTTKIEWLDLSFNNIESLPDGFFAAFPNLKKLYLQANKIKKLSQIRKLSQLKELNSLAMYGNPVEENKHYRNYVLYMCPKLTVFDQSTVTKTERTMCEIWQQTFRRKLHPEE